MTIETTTMVARLMDAVTTGKLSLETLMDNMAVARTNAEQAGAGQGALSAAEVIEIAHAIRHHYLRTGQWTKDCLFDEEWAIVRAQLMPDAPRPAAVPANAWQCRICRADLVSTQVLSGLCASCDDTTTTWIDDTPDDDEALDLHQPIHILEVDGDVTIRTSLTDSRPSTGWTIRTRQNDYTDLEVQRGSVIRTYRVQHTIDAHHVEARLLKAVGTVLEHYAPVVAAAKAGSHVDQVCCPELRMAREA